jgi:hypothetical protein
MAMEHTILAAVGSIGLKSFSPGPKRKAAANPIVGGANSVHLRTD